MFFRKTVFVFYVVKKRMFFKNFGTTYVVFVESQHFSILKFFDAHTLGGKKGHYVGSSGSGYFVSICFTRPISFTWLAKYQRPVFDGLSTFLSNKG